MRKTNMNNNDSNNNNNDNTTPNQKNQNDVRQQREKRNKRQQKSTVNILKRETRVISVPPGHVWLEGDNPYNSTDSRDYGPVPIALLKGKIIFQLYPFSKFGSPQNPLKDDLEYTGVKKSIKYPIS